MTCILIACLTFLLLPASADLTFSHLTAGENDWPQWRGPDFNGMARGDAPLQWSDAKNIKWKTDIPGRGFSTPVIWGNRVFLTTAIPTGTPPPPPPPPPDGQAQGGGRRGPGGGGGPQIEHKFIAMALDKTTGKVVWERTVKTATPHEGHHRTYGSFASNSPATDGKYVYFSFGSRGIYCFDFNGKLIWEKDFGKLQMFNQFGEGVAPVVHGDRLILAFDHQGGSFITVLDKTTGKEVWRVPREETTSWAAPLVVDYKGKKQIITSASSKVRSYDFDSGRLIWECAGLGRNVIPMPVAQDDLVFVMSGYTNPKLMAIRLGKEGDLTGTDAIVWTQTRGLSYTAAPVLHDGKFYALTDNGMLSCFNAKTGEPYYHQTRLPNPENFKASPLGVNGKLYLASESGNVYVIKMGEKFEVLATNAMPDQIFISSPVVVGGELFLRSQNQLYCISEKK
jgi:outer membrane protein assembly factor BamB